MENSLTQYFYERNTKFLDSKINLPFEDILWMTDQEFRDWIIQLRKDIVHNWNVNGIPPVVGKSKDDIIDGMKKIIASNPKEMECVDLITGEKNVIRSTKTELSGICNSWFPTMMKTKITYSTKKESYSIYDYFNEDKLLETFTTYTRRHFKRDSFYHYSIPISYGDRIEVLSSVYNVTTSDDFIKWYEDNDVQSNGYDYWYCPVQDKKEYTGYNQDLKMKKNLVVHIDDIPKDAPSRTITNVDRDRSEFYSIRFYKYGQKIFPLGFKSFRISFAQYPVNFPALIARYLYERYTEDFKDQEQINIYDPSSGWAGRLTGAMCSDINRNFHYIGTDPNRDHNTSDGKTKYHSIGNFINEEIRSKGRLYKKKHTFEIFQNGSETIKDNPGFQKYKGKIDLVFTSPPYFAKEQYSADPEQSCHTFPVYENWRDGFLRPTLETAVEYLRPGRYLLWNIADAAFDGTLLPLEQDSIDILKSLGMKHVETLKMALAAMPGSNRFEETGKENITYENTIYGRKEIKTPILKGKMKNFCEIESGGKSQLLKYEPIMVFYKQP